MFLCEIIVDGIIIQKPTPYPSLKEIAKDLELSCSQIYDIYEGRTTKKYLSRIMPKITIKRFIAL